MKKTLEFGYTQDFTSKLSYSFSLQKDIYLSYLSIRKLAIKKKNEMHLCGVVVSLSKIQKIYCDCI